MTARTQWSLSLGSIGLASLILILSLIKSGQPDMIGMIRNPSVSDDLILDEVSKRDFSVYLQSSSVLPDHPFYLIQMFLDRLNLLSEREKERHILTQINYADQRLGSAQALAKEYKDRLAAITATKGTLYMHNVIHEVRLLENEGESTTALWQKIYNHSSQHCQILKQMTIAFENEPKSLLKSPLDTCIFIEHEAKKALKLVTF